MPKRHVIFDISSMTIIKVVLVLLGLIFVYVIRDIVAILIASIVIASALKPPVEWLSKKKIPRAISVLFIYLVLIGLLALIVYLLIPPITEQIKELSVQFPGIYDEVIPRLFGTDGFSMRQEFINNAQQYLTSLAENIGMATRGFFNVLGSFFGGVLSVVAVLVLSFYIIVQVNALRHFTQTIFPAKHRDYVLSLLDRIQVKIGLWLRGQLILSLIIGTLVSSQTIKSTSPKTRSALNVISSRFPMGVATILNIKKFKYLDFYFLSNIIPVIHIIFGEYRNCGHYRNSQKHTNNTGELSAD